MGSMAQLAAVMRRFRIHYPKFKLKVIRTDFSKAFRACPVSPSHHPWASIRVRYPDGFRFFTQLAMPFGAVAAVYAWDRLGAAARAIILHVLYIFMCRYVDDLFGCDYALLAETTRRYLLSLFSLLGLRLEKSKTPHPSHSQSLLGVVADVSLVDSLRVSFDQDKVMSWLSLIAALIHDPSGGSIGTASLAGKLSNACWTVGGPRLRSRLLSLFRVSQKGIDGVDMSSLMADIDFIRTFVSDTCNERRYRLAPPVDDPVVVFTDATGKGGAGAVLILKELQDAHCAVGHVPESLRQRPTVRKTQVTPYKLLVPLAATLTWPSLMTAKVVIFYLDNDAAQGILFKGSSTSPDLNCIAGDTWDVLHSLGIEPFFKRVPSALNCSDPLSRSRPSPFGRRPILLRWQD